MIRKCWFMVALIFAGACAGRAAIVADWTFETSVPNAYGTTIGGIVAESGDNASTSTASGVHANSKTSWSSPLGNQTLHSFSADYWAANDYYQFSVSTVGFVQISVAFDQISSSTGPANFHFEYSTDAGASFSTFADYAIKHTAFTISSTTFNENLSAMTGLDNSAGVVFRLVDANSISENGATVQTGGTDKIDNFVVSGISAVPETPAWGAISGAGLLALCGWRVWRQRRCEENLKS